MELTKIETNKILTDQFMVAEAFSASERATPIFNSIYSFIHSFIRSFIRSFIHSTHCIGVSKRCVCGFLYY